MSVRRWRWYCHPLFLVTLALATHLVAVWAMPWVIMDRVFARLAAESHGRLYTSAYFPPPSDGGQRRIVMPSPDLLYALCAYDLAAGPLEVDVAPQLNTYWSVALYAANTDNFWVVNDRQMAGRAVRWQLVPNRLDRPLRLPDGRTQLVSPTRRGLLLMRVLAGEGPAAQAAADKARRTLRCVQR